MYGRMLGVALVCAAGMSISQAKLSHRDLHNTPDVTQWFKAAKSQSRTPCCDEADGYREGVEYPMQIYWDPDHETQVILRDWRVAARTDGTKPPEGKTEYDINVLGEWQHVTYDKIVEGINPVGQAIAWVVINLSSFNNVPTHAYYVRCFAPGNLS